MFRYSNGTAAKVARENWEKTGLPGVATRTEPFLVSRAERRRVIAASSVGTVFEWYASISTRRLRQLRQAFLPARQ